jgi:diguanylate cyclase (GGDEF)-like protein
MPSGRRKGASHAGGSRTRRRLAQLDGLLGMAEQLAGTIDSQSAAAAALDALVTLHGFPRAALLTVDAEKIALLATHGVSHHRVAGRPESRAVDAALRRAKPQLLQEVARDEEPWLARLVPDGSTVLIVPMVVDGDPLGVLLLQLPVLRDKGWAQSLLEPLERGASITARTLRTVRRIERLELMAATDSLTSIPNRRNFTTSLERELARSSRTGNPVSLVMFDLDDFKRVNDQHGHQAGDDVLRGVAEALQVACRDLDTAARYGGEEFVVILPDCPPERSIEVAERLRTAVSAADLPHRLTASAGVASYPEHADDLEGLVRAADEALLLSKRSGRNRTTAASVLNASIRTNDAS